MSLLNYLLRCIISVLTLAPCFSLAMLVGLIDQKRGIQIIIGWIRFFLRIFHIEITVENENHSAEKLTGCEFILLNQTSLLDGPIVLLAVPQPCKWITNIEFALIPFLGWSAWVFGWVVIRQWPNQAKRALERVRSFLKGGGNLLISIEGRRSKNGSLSAYRKGPVVLAINSQAKIVPVMFYGVRNCLGYGDWRIRPGKVTVRLLQAIPTKDLIYEHRDVLVSRLYNIAEQELARNTAAIPT